MCVTKMMDTFSIFTNVTRNEITQKLRERVFAGQVVYLIFSFVIWRENEIFQTNMILLFYELGFYRTRLRHLKGSTCGGVGRGGGRLVTESRLRNLFRSALVGT